MFFSIMMGVTGIRASSGSRYFLRSVSEIVGLWVCAQTVRKSSASTTPASGVRLPIATMRSAAWSKFALARMIFERPTSSRSRRLAGNAASHLPVGALGSKSSGATSLGRELVGEVFCVNVFSASASQCSAIICAS